MDHCQSATNADEQGRAILEPWMRRLLRFVAGFNIAAGLFMLLLYHEAYQLIGMPKPQIDFPLQLVGLLVALYGVGYYLVARDPLQNRNLLVLGFWSKFLGSVLGTYTVLQGELPPRFVLVYFFADVIYLPPFYWILRHLADVTAGGRRAEECFTAVPAGGCTGAGCGAPGCANPPISAPP